MRLVLLSDAFYSIYQSCPEILQKRSRPYACLDVEVNGVHFAIPFRHHIRHRNAFITYGTCGLDYTKAVVILKETYLDTVTPSIDRKEWDIIRRNENKILYEFKRFLKQYKRAMRYPDNPRSANILKFSALQYFEQYIGGI